MRNRIACSIAILLAGISMVGAVQKEKKWDVTVVRTFDAPVAKVWQAWSDSELIKKWWAPTGFTCPVAKIDFRIKGKSLLCMRAPKEMGGGDTYTTWAYSKIVPNRQIDFVLEFSDKDGKKVSPQSLGLPAGIPGSVKHEITFKTLAGGKTEMTYKEFGYTDEMAANLSKMGLDQVLDKMAALFK